MGKHKPAKASKKNSLDDTPRQFRRIMEMKKQLTQPKNGKVSKPLSRSGRTDPPLNHAKSEEAPVKLERKRGESLYEFSRRVDQAIPLPRARGTDSRKTVKNAKKHKVKAENLRAEYKQRLDAKNRRLEESYEDSLEVPDDGEDIWAAVNARANRPKFGEVADRPPELPPLKQTSSIPKSAGSMARRQMLEEERQRFIAEYRKLRGTGPEAHAEPDDAD